jgi:hypothetical protein
VGAGAGVFTGNRQTAYILKDWRTTRATYTVASTNISRTVANTNIFLSQNGRLTLNYSLARNRWLGETDPQGGCLGSGRCSLSQWLPRAYRIIFSHHLAGLPSLLVVANDTSNVCKLKIPTHRSIRKALEEVRWILPRHMLMLTCGMCILHAQNSPRIHAPASQPTSATRRNLDFDPPSQPSAPSAPQLKASSSSLLSSLTTLPLFVAVEKGKQERWLDPQDPEAYNRPNQLVLLTNNTDCLACGVDPSQLLGNTPCIAAPVRSHCGR